MDCSREDSLLESLKTTAQLGNYNRWLMSLARPYLSGRVIEIGSGLGTMSSLIRGADALVLSDRDEDLVRRLQDLFRDRKEVSCVQWDIADAPPPELRGFDTAVSFNVLEHVTDDRRALENMKRVLRPGGKLALFVPACARIAGELDRALGHRRRYSIRGLEEKLDSAGFDVLEAKYVNLPGAVAWWLNFRLFARRRLPEVQSKLFDAVVPLVAAVERAVRPPFGQSLFAAATRR